jgi:hypothetical protein
VNFESNEPEIVTNEYPLSEGIIKKNEIIVLQPGIAGAKFKRRFFEFVIPNE